MSPKVWLAAALWINDPDEDGEDKEWKDVQKKDTNKRPSETINKRKTRKKIINVGNEIL